MSHIIIDRTIESKNKSLPNRDKFIKRAKEQIKKSLKEYITDSADIKSINDGKSKKVKISKKSIQEPYIVHSSNNTRKQVYVGNKTFQKGDVIEKPPKNGGGGQQSGNGGDGEDDFYFTISHEEFVEFFFEDLELPDLIKKSIMEETTDQYKRVGFSNDGPPPKLDLLRTMQNAMKRNFAIYHSIDDEIEELEKQLEDAFDKEKIISSIRELKTQKENIPFIQDLDLRYRKTELVKEPITKACMIMLMDVSGSMTQWHKEMSKRFFMLLYMFLTRQYKSVELVFVKYHHEASEVDEEDFFYSRETGGTVVANGLELVDKIISERYQASQYNVYVSHCSDGDTYGNEDASINEWMTKILSKIQYYAYVNIIQDIEWNLLLQNKNLYTIFKELKNNLPLSMQHKLECREVTHVRDIYYVFRNLFENSKS